MNIPAFGDLQSPAKSGSINIMNENGQESDRLHPFFGICLFSFIDPDILNHRRAS